MNTKSIAPSSNASMGSSKKALGPFCLLKQQRLKTPADFQRVYQSKQWGASKHFSYNVRASESGSVNTVGVTVSKKVSKRAVDRNRLKRELREFYRLRQQQLDGANLVLTAKPSSKTVSRDERQQSLEELWAKLLKWQRWHQRQMKKEIDRQSLRPQGGE